MPTRTRRAKAEPKTEPETPAEPEPVAEEPAPEPAPEPVEQPPAPLPAVIEHHDLSIVPASSEIAMLGQMAVTLAAAGLVPAALRDKPNDVFLILLTARDLGVALTTAMREFHPIEGKVTLSPKVRLAMVNDKGRQRGWRVWPDPDNDDKGATWYAQRDDRPGLTFASHFDMHDADRVPAKEGGKAIKLHEKSNWRAYPKRMLSWRALGYLLDDVFPEVGTGLYSPDELGAVTDEDGNAILDVTSVEPLPGTQAPRSRRNRGAPAEPDTGNLAAPDETIAAFRARIQHLPEAGKAALLEMWTKHDEQGNVSLPPLARIVNRNVKKVEAMVASIEVRARKGEWGEWEPLPQEPATAPQTAQEGPQPGSEGEHTPDPPTSPEAAPGGPHDYERCYGCRRLIDTEVAYDPEGNPYHAGSCPSDGTTTIVQGEAKTPEPAPAPAPADDPDGEVEHRHHQGEASELLHSHVDGEISHAHADDGTVVYVDEETGEVVPPRPSEDQPQSGS